ncbi:MAG TPA: sigma-54 dependent transcriptional regulator, partial [Gemmatimonadaceae bacterium]|nr:sigma-54 dependent transcriptional regulator [Gemmatimonadaceae bacterium]
GIDGIRLVETLRIWGEQVPVLMISGYGTVESAVRALHVGTDDFLTKPVEPELLSARVAELLERRPVTAPDDAAVGGMVGRTPVMRELFAAVRRVAPQDTTVLITGETGTGKELVARAVHQLSPRHAAPFIAVNCGAFGEGVLESELFGHVKGAFTGAIRDRAGVFEAADGGTIFLDEIGETSLSVQQRLLRVLQEREVTRVGASRPVRVDVRVVAATNRDLASQVAAGRFRDDLYYRLAVFPLGIAPLRDRRADVPLLVAHALNQLRPRASDPAALGCSSFAIRLLRAHDWPGNVRQLMSTVERAAVDAGFGRIEAQHLPPELREAAEARAGNDSRYRAAASADDEREIIAAALEQTGGAVSRTAELLGMGRTTLWRKLRQYGLTPIANDHTSFPDTRE